MTATKLDQSTEAFNEAFKKRAAIFITGETPAVVTETLCMLLRGECHSHLNSGEKHLFEPTEIHIITTRGDDDSGPDGFIKQWKGAGLEAVLNCLKEYGINKIHEITIDLWFITTGADATDCWADSAAKKCMIENSAINLSDWKSLKIRAHNAALPGKGDALSDIRTDAENSAAGDYVARVLRKLTHGDGAADRAIHASMAGGRKTMSGYMKGAMWLLACIIHEHYEKVRQSVCDSSRFMNNAG
jgi:CRISPR-associated protein (TIGR02584 family)